MTAAMTATVSKEDFDLCDLENSNLRKCLAWCGARLAIEDRRILIEMIKHPIEQGGVIEDGREQDRHDLIECEKLLRRMAEHIEKAIDDADALIAGWFFEAEALCERAREWEPKKQEPTLAELRQEWPLLKLPFAHGKTAREQGGSSR